MIHKGVRPQYDIEMLDFKRKIWIEEMPDGSYKLWNKKMLKSGCGNESKDTKELMGCYYCSYCDEWFSKEQWI